MNEGGFTSAKLRKLQVSLFAELRPTADLRFSREGKPWLDLRVINKVETKNLDQRSHRRSPLQQ